MSRRHAWIAGVTGALFAVLSPAAAYASETTDEEASELLSFGYWESSDFQDVYASITEANKPAAAASLSGAALEDPALLPGLAGLPDLDRAEVLDAAASAASTGSELPASVVARVGGWGLESTILGQPIANGFAWQHKDRYNLAICESGPSSCEVEDWMDFTYTIDPGGVGTRLTVKTLTWGNRLTGHRVGSMVFCNAEMIKLKDGPERSGDGTYQVLLSPHLTLTGYRFIAAFQSEVYNNAAVPAELYTFRTNSSLRCEEPEPGAWRCKLPD